MSDPPGVKRVGWIVRARTGNPPGAKGVGRIARARIDDPPGTKRVGRMARVQTDSKNNSLEIFGWNPDLITTKFWGVGGWLNFQFAQP